MKLNDDSDGFKIPSGLPLIEIFSAIAAALFVQQQIKRRAKVPPITFQLISRGWKRNRAVFVRIGFPKQNVFAEFSHN